MHQVKCKVRDNESQALRARRLLIETVVWSRGCCVRDMRRLNLRLLKRDKRDTTGK